MAGNRVRGLSGESRWRKIEFYEYADKAHTRTHIVGKNRSAERHYVYKAWVIEDGSTDRTVRHFRYTNRFESIRFYQRSVFPF